MVSILRGGGGLNMKTVTISQKQLNKLNTLFDKLEQLIKNMEETIGKMETEGD